MILSAFYVGGLIAALPRCRNNTERAFTKFSVGIFVTNMVLEMLSSTEL